MSSDSTFIGSDFRVLSWVSYGSDSSLDTTVPFTEDLKHQHGVDVTCIPYTISPFAGLSMADAATESILLKNDLSMVPKSIDTHLFAAYPVLFPLYLAQYEYPVPGKERLVTLFIEASEPNGRIRSEKLDTGSDVRGMFPLAPKSFVDFTHALDEVDVPCLHGDPAPFFRLFGFQLPSEKRDLSRTLRRQLDEAVVSHGMGPKLVEESGIISSSDDPRIRPYTMEERENVREWLSLSQQIESMSRVAESIRKTHDLTIANDKEFPQEVFNKTIESLESKIAELQAEQKATTPEWWKDWQNIPQ
ncbi:hypothetical protein C0991_010577 [Blastosporella zonata]|nr:hypothetical protein C0991_010577 [Blastosporella zonata]